MYNDWAERTCIGRLFQARGPATQKALSPNDSRVLGTSKIRRYADRKPLLRPTEGVGTTGSARYRGALPCKHRKTSVQSLYSILSVIGSQWWSRSRDVTWSYFLAPVTSRTDELGLIAVVECHKPADPRILRYNSPTESEQEKCIPTPHVARRPTVNRNLLRLKRWRPSTMMANFFGDFTTWYLSLWRPQHYGGEKIFCGDICDIIPIVAI